MTVKVARGIYRDPSGKELTRPEVESWDNHHGLLRFDYELIEVEEDKIAEWLEAQK